MSTDVSSPAPAATSQIGKALAEMQRLADQRPAAPREELILCLMTLLTLASQNEAAVTLEDLAQLHPETRLLAVHSLAIFMLQTLSES